MNDIRSVQVNFFEIQSLHKNHTLMQNLHSLTANMDKSAKKIAKNIKMNEIVDEYEDMY